MPPRAHCQYRFFISYTLAYEPSRCSTNAGPFDPCGPQLSDERILLLYHASIHYHLRLNPLDRRLRYGTLVVSFPPPQARDYQLLRNIERFSVQENVNLIST